MSNKLFFTVNAYISKELNRALTQAENAYLADLYKQLDHKQFAGHKLSEVAAALGKIFTKKIRDRPIDQEIDFREYQKAQLGSSEAQTIIQEDSQTVTSRVPTDYNISEFLGIDDLSELKMMFNPSSMLVHYYVALDSDYRDTSEEIATNITKFTWKYAPTQNLVAGFCNSVGVVSNIIGMRLYQPRLPYKVAMAGTSKRVSILIEEFKAQAFIAENGRRFHFLLRPNLPGGTSIELSTEDFNDGIFNFRKPFTTIDRLTISVGDPTNVISFNTPFDRFMLAMEFICYKE